MTRTRLLSLGALASMAFQAAAFAQPQTNPAAGPKQQETAAAPRGLDSGLLLAAPLVIATEAASADEADGETGRMFRLTALPEAAAGGVRLLRFTAPAAAAYRFYFQGVALPQGARMFLYGLDTSGRVTTVFGPYEQSGPLAQGSFRSRVIPGVEAVIEIQGMENGPWPFRIPQLAAIDAGVLSDLRISNSESLTETPEQRKPPRGERTQIEHNGRLVGAEIIGGDVVVEGDILVSPNEVPSKDNRRSAVIRTEASGRWPQGVVPFVIDSVLAADARIPAAVLRWQIAMDGFLAFVPRTTEPDFVRFTRVTESVCQSGAGRTSGARVIKLSDLCSTANVVHEIGHAIGFRHEQTREDRDKFVRIVWDNIQDDKDHNFEINGGDAHTDFGGYDFASIMHYPLDAFSKNGQNTIVPLVPVPVGVTPGAATVPSKGDVSALKSLSLYGATVSHGVVNVPAAGGTFGVRVTTQDDRFWTAQDDAAWVTLTSGSSGLGTGVVHFSVASNEPVLTQGFASLITPVQGPRTASLNVALAPFGRTATVQIIQAPPNCSFSVSPTKILAAAEAGTYTVKVTTTSNCSWGASEAVPWLGLSPASGQGTGTVFVNVQPNANTNPNKPPGTPRRTGTIVVAGKTVTIEQAGECALSVCPE